MRVSGLGVSDLGFRVQGLVFRFIGFPQSMAILLCGIVSEGSL